MEPLHRLIAALAFAFARALAPGALEASIAIINVGKSLLFLPAPAGVGMPTTT